MGGPTEGNHRREDRVRLHARRVFDFDAHRRPDRDLDATDGLAGIRFGRHEHACGILQARAAVPDRDRLTDAVLDARHEGPQIDRLIIDRNDLISGFQSGLRRRTAGNDVPQRHRHGGRPELESEPLEHRLQLGQALAVIRIGNGECRGAGIA